MIVNVLFYIAGFFLEILGWIFSLGSWVLPKQFTDTIIFWLSHLNYVRGFVDVETLFTTLGLYLSFLSVFYILKISTKIFAAMPLFGRPVDIASLSKDPNTVDLRKRKGKLIMSGRVFKNKTMRDIRRIK